MPASFKEQVSKTQKQRWKQKPELHALVSSKLKVNIHLQFTMARTSYLHSKCSTEDVLHAFTCFDLYHRCHGPASSSLCSSCIVQAANLVAGSIHSRHHYMPDWYKTDVPTQYTQDLAVVVLHCRALSLGTRVAQ